MPKNTIIPAMGGPGLAPPVPEQGVRFDRTRATNLRGYFSGAAETTWTISAWVKITGDLNTVRTLFEARQDANNLMRIYFDASNRLNYETTVGGVVVSEHRTARFFVDVGNWFHIMYSFAANSQIRLDLNGYLFPGIQQLVVATPGNGVGYSWLASGVEHFIGSNALNADNFSGVIGELHVTEGVKVATAFGQFNANGTWERIAYAGVHGSQGFYLTFGRTVDLGEDFSGNANDFPTHTNAASDQFDDWMERNYCIIDVNDPDTIVSPTEGGLDNVGSCRVTMRPETGVWYYEKNGVGVVWDTGVSGRFNPLLLVGSYNFGQLPFVGVGPGGGELTLCSPNLPVKSIVNARAYFAAVEYAGAATNPRVVTGPGIAGAQFDVEHGDIQHRTDMVWAKNMAAGQNHYISYRLRTNRQIPLNTSGQEELSNTNGTISDLPDPGPGFETTDGATNNLNFNEFGNVYSAISWRAEEYAQNIPTAVDSDDAEEIQPFPGAVDIGSSDLELNSEADDAASEQQVGLRFLDVQIPQGATVLEARIQFEADETRTTTPCDVEIFCQDADNPPTFVAANGNISSRPKTSGVKWTNVPGWTLQDRLAAQLTPNFASAVQEVVDRIGWAAGNALVVVITHDQASANYERRTAEGAGSGTPIDAHEPMLQVKWRQALPVPGVSVFTYTGVGKVANVMHGLGVTPEFFAVKRRTGTTDSWRVYCELIQTALPTPQDGALAFNNSGAAIDDVAIWNDSAPNASFIVVGTAGHVNEEAQEHMGLAMASVQGFSKVFRYVGLGGSNGPLVNLGFKPRMILIKRADAIADWFLVTRVLGAGAQVGNAQFNQTGQNLYLDTSGGALNDDNIHIFSHGFHIIDSTAPINTLNGEYIGIAFAEAAFENAKATP